MRTNPTRRLSLRLALTLGAAAMLACGCEPSTPPAGGDGTGGGGTNDAPSGAGTAPAATIVGAKAPKVYFETDFDAWIGQPWNAIPLMQYLPAAPTGIDGPGTHYVVFYNRTCEHCEEMFNQDFADESLAAQVTAVEVPQKPDLMTSPDAWPVPDVACEHLALPLGTDWIIQTPLAVRVEDGVIRCAVEGEHKGCLGLE